jgi:hypothetical protein
MSQETTSLPTQAQVKRREKGKKKREGKKKRRIKKIIYYDSNASSSSPNDDDDFSKKRSVNQNYSFDYSRIPFNSNAHLLSIPLGKPPHFDGEDYSFWS